MTKQKLNLLQFSPARGRVAHTCGGDLWSEVLDSGLAGRSFDDMPDRFRRDPFSPDLPESVHSTKHWTLVGTGCIGLIIHGPLRPNWYGNGANMFSLPTKSAGTQWSSRSWKSSFFNPTSSARRSPHAINNARIARSRLPRAVSIASPRSRSLAWSTLSQFPILTPNRLAPFTRRMPA